MTLKNTLSSQEMAYLQEIERLWTTLEAQEQPFSKPSWLKKKMAQWQAQKPLFYENYKRALNQDLSKAQIFSFYFQAGQERFAKRSVQGHYYSPCQNINNPLLCMKSLTNYQYSPKNPCHKCAHRLFSVLSSQDLLNHLFGKHHKGLDGLAIASLKEDGTTLFLTFEIEKSWSNTQALRKTLQETGFSPLCIQKEKGIWQLWIFFEVPLDAQKVANLAQILLLKAVVTNGLNDLSLFDHFIPVGPAKKPGDIGRFVTLPLDGWLAKEGLSLFLDEDGFPYFDQWQTLDHTPKVSQAMVEEILSKESFYHMLLDPTLFNEKKESYQYASSLLASSSLDPFSFESSQVQGAVNITLHQEIEIETGNLTPTFQALLFLMGGYWNPAYLQNGGRFASGSRIICQSRLENGKLFLPRGLLEELKQRFKGAGIEYVFDDKRQKGKDLALIFQGELRPEQKELIDALAQKECGILEAATGMGKTVMGAALIAQKQTSTLVLVHSKEILAGWVRTLNSFLRFEQEDFEKPLKSKAYLGKIGVLQGKTNTLTKRIDIAMVPSLASKENLEELVQGYGLVLVDECHHAASSTMVKVLSKIQAKSIYGLSATPERTDGFSESVCLQLGKVISRFDSRQQMALQSFSRHYVICPTTFEPFEMDSDFIRLCQEAASSPLRNGQIVGDVKEALAQGKTILVLTRFVEHAKLLAKWIQKATPTAQVLVYAGNDNPKEKQVNTQRLKELSKQKQVVLVGTISSIGEGFDFPALDTLLLTLPMRSQISISQAIGRIHRQTHQKKSVVVYDYMDSDIVMFKKMFEARKAEYKSQGYQELEEKSSAFYAPFKIQEKSAFDFFQMLKQEFSQPHQLIALATRKLEEENLALLMRWLHKMDLNQIRLDLFLEEASDLQQEELISRGIHLHLHERIIERFAIFDKSLVYYGSIFDSTSKTGLIIEDSEFANQLLDLRRQAEIQKMRANQLGSMIKK